jgi:hypothetical protein
MDGHPSIGHPVFIEIRLSRNAHKALVLDTRHFCLSAVNFNPPDVFILPSRSPARQKN